MKIKNPIRTYMNWYGRNLVEIAAEPTGKAILHYGKFTAKVALASFAAAAVIYGGAIAGQKIYEKIQEGKDE